MPLAESPPGGLAHRGKGIRKKLFEGGAVGDLAAELVCLRLKLGVAQFRILGF